MKITTRTSRTVTLLVRSAMAAVLVIVGVGVTASASSAAPPICRHGWGNFFTSPYPMAALDGPVQVAAPSYYGSIGCNIPIGTNQKGDWTGNVYTTSPDETGVGLLQRTLNLCYGYNLTVDGIYGANTTAAVKSVQAITFAKGGADGIYGINTSAAMKHPTVTSSHALTTPCHYLA